MNVSFGAVRSYNQYYPGTEGRIGSITGQGELKSGDYEFTALQYTKDNPIVVTLYRPSGGNGSHQEEIRFQVEPKDTANAEMTLIQREHQPQYRVMETPRGFYADGERDQLLQDAKQIATKLRTFHSKLNIKG